MRSQPTLSEQCESIIAALAPRPTWLEVCGAINQTVELTGRKCPEYWRYTARLQKILDSGLPTFRNETRSRY